MVPKTGFRDKLVYRLFVLRLVQYLYKIHLIDDDEVERVVTQEYVDSLINGNLPVSVQALMLSLFVVVIGMVFGSVRWAIGCVVLFGAVFKISEVRMSREKLINQIVEGKFRLTYSSYV